jgi:sorting nexin-1/2
MVQQQQQQPGGGGGAGGGQMTMSDVMLSQPLPHTAVLRRYSDFLWLYERLHTERAGAIVPPIPDKQPVGRFNSAFVEERRHHLERFLRRVATHPELADAGCLDLFLRADDVTFHAAKNAKGTMPNAGSLNNSMMMQYNHPAMQQQQQQSMAGGPAAMVKKEGIKRWFAEAKTSMTGDLVRSPDDDLFEEIHRYVSTLDKQMTNVTQQASGLVRKSKEIANGLFEFGLAFNLLGQSEADSLGAALSEMGGTADRISVLSAEHAEREMREFEEPLQDYVKTIHAVKLALQRRQEKRVTYSTCLAEVEAKNVQLGKLRMQIGSEAKAYSTEMSLRRAQEAADGAREDFAAVSQRVLREVDRFKREKAEDMRRVVLDYINLQVEYNKRMEEVWATLIPKLEAVQQQQQHHPMQPPPQPVSGAPIPVSPEASPPIYTNAPPTNMAASSSLSSFPGPSPHMMMMANPHVGATPMPPQMGMPHHPPPPVPPSMYGDHHSNSNFLQQQQQQQQHVAVPPPDPSSMLNVQYRDTSTLPGM